jgi:hypothetical protein
VNGLDGLGVAESGAAQIKRAIRQQIDQYDQIRKQPYSPYYYN